MGHSQRGQSVQKVQEWFKAQGLKLLLVVASLGGGSFSMLHQNPAADGTSTQNNEFQKSAPQDLEEIEFSSIRAKGGARETELGQAVAKKLNVKKEQEVILKDPAISQMWGLKVTDAQRAWRVTTGSKDIVVAIIDTGIDVRHPDLSDNLWTNPGETGKDAKGRDKAANGIDDDGNGYVDDVHGWNFVDNNNILTDNHGHGTHVAGIVGGVGGNGIGIVGISPKVSLMAIKYYDPKAPGVNNLVNTVKAIQYAVKMNANVINYSGGGLEPSSEERRAIELAANKGILFVAAAGNERSNSDLKGYYPADYGLPNIISVTAIDKFKQVLPTSNYGERTVDLAAPGNDIFSTLPSGQYGFLTGTSQATAFATGVAALVMANNSELKKADRIIKYLTQTGDTSTELEGKTRYHKILNSYKALAIQDKDLSITGVRTENSLHLAAATFSADPNAITRADGAADLSALGKAMQKALQNDGLKTAPVIKTAQPTF